MSDANHYFQKFVPNVFSLKLGLSLVAPRFSKFVKPLRIFEMKNKGVGDYVLDTKRSVSNAVSS